MKKNIYVGTRGSALLNSAGVTFSDAIMSPSAPFGGLFAPNSIKVISNEDLLFLSSLSYVDLALHILNYLEVDIHHDTLCDALSCYKNFDNPENPVPVVRLDERTFVSELWHGPSRAFKDQALEPFPPTLSYLAQLQEINLLIVVTTTGDTGPATLYGFRNLPNTKVICYYPVGGTSSVQAEQMKKALGDNLKVVGVHSNFDVIQRRMKVFLRDDKIKSTLSQKGYGLSAANSVNFGRIAFQIVYHFWNYFQLCEKGEIKLSEEITLVIPSGNFGNALAAFYANMMGLPIKKIVLASNENNILTDFVNKGVYDIRDRKLILTISPAMDILISSNVERLLFHLFGEERTRDLMFSLEEYKYFELTYDEKKVIQNIFSAGYATDEEVNLTISWIKEDYDYLIDPHTATAFVVRDGLEIYEDKTIILSTAEWTKFPETIAKVFGCEQNFDSITKKLGVQLPKQISRLLEMPVVHDKEIDEDDMLKELLDFV